MFICNTTKIESETYTLICYVTDRADVTIVIMSDTGLTWSVKYWCIINDGWMPTISQTEIIMKSTPVVVFYYRFELYITVIKILYHSFIVGSNVHVHVCAISPSLKTLACFYISG